MNPDYYSDIKLAERLIFQNSIYLLNMFDKKVDSFITNKTKQARDRQRLELLHKSNIIDPDGRLQDPLKALSKDLTKPVWNCVTKMEVVAVCGGTREQDTPEMVAGMYDIFSRFLRRLKHEHEDESSFRMQLQMVDRARLLQKATEEIANYQLERSWELLGELLRLLGKVCDRHKNELKERNEQNEFMEVYLQWSRLIFDQFNVKRESQPMLDLFHFTRLVGDHMKAVIESSQGPTCINYWPNLHLLPDLLHPMLISIYCTIRQQLVYERASKEEKAGGGMVGGIFGSTTTLASSVSFEEESDCVFEELPKWNCSKITFLNLDGYQSAFNLSIAKYLCKYVQYISFPCEDGEALQSQSYYPYMRNHSEFLLKHYLFSQLTEEERAFQHRLFRTKEKTDRELLEYYRQLFILPVRSIYLSQRHDLSSVEYYQSKFIKFMVKELVYIQVKEFNPSLIVISLSNRLHLDSHFYQELIKELTVIANMRVILYNNLNRSFLFETPLPSALLPAEPLFQCLRHHARKYHSSSFLFQGNDLNFPILDHTAVFLKVTSGTHSLDRTVEQDSVAEKYDVFRVQKYAATLLKMLGKAHPVLERFRNRSNEYLRLERMLAGIYQAQRTAEDDLNKFPLYHQQLLHLAKQMIDRTIGEQTSSMPFLRVGSEGELNSAWQDFSLRYRMIIRKQREDEDYKFITRLKRTSREGEGEQESADFIALQFEIERGGITYLVNIGKQSQICMDTVKQGKTALVYLFNHLLEPRQGVLRSYCGEFDEYLQQSYEDKVRLRELQLPFQALHPCQHLTEFSYLETPSTVLLFWPTLYDQAQALASSFLHTQYHPPITSLIFAANRATPHRFLQVVPSNTSYTDVLPRRRCTCYRVPQTECIYIFGGFYASKEDYLNFQTDITLLQLAPEVQLTNVPKNFYFDYQPTNPQYTDLPSRITKLNQDFVRPRVEYEVLELEGEEDLEKRRILLVGGVGERFLRPYSMVGYMAHRIAFTKKGQLLQVRRLRLNNLVPLNLRRPVRTRLPAELPLAQGAQNRQIYQRKTTVPAGTGVFSWFPCRYARQQEKMTYRVGGELAVLPQSREERCESTLTIKQRNSQVTAKAVLRHYSSLREVDNKLAVVYQFGSPVQQSYSIIFSLQLEMAEDIYLRCVNQPSREVPLTGAHLLAVDTLGLQAYALIQHKEYTAGRCVLAHCDIAGTVLGAEQHERRLVLKEIYRFDADMRNCTLKVLPDRRVALLHAFPMHLVTYTIPQCILKRTSRGHFVREQVRNDYPSYALTGFLTQQVYRSRPLTFFFTNRQTVVAWSFRSSSRGIGQEEYFFQVEQLPLREESRRWRNKTLKTIKFQKMFVTIGESTCWVTTILDIRVTEKKYQLFLSEGHKIYVGNFQAHSADTEAVTFRDYEKTLEEYHAQKYYHKSNVEYLQKLTKYPSRYQEGLEEMESMEVEAERMQ